MILLVVLAVALIYALLRGGRLEHLALVPIRRSYIMVLALWIQIVIFSSWWQAEAARAVYTNALYVVSLALLMWGVWINRRVPGVAIIGIGLVLNAVVIVANGGTMPASISALKVAGVLAPDATFETLRVTNSSLIHEGTPLWFLGDVFAVPAWIPLANVFSLGDILIGAGGVHFLVRNTRPPDRPA
jgi:hypothetical protein